MAMAFEFLHLFLGICLYLVSCILYLQRMKRFLSLAALSLGLVACVDTTGLSAESSRPSHPRSNANAAVVVEEFADLQCPSCKAASTMIVPPMLEKYGAQIRYDYHQFPLSSIHRYAMDAAEASECAADQGKFWEFVDVAFAKQEELSPAALDAWGEALELDTDLYERCRASHIKRDTIQAEYDAGRALGVTGTPTFFVNGKKVESTIEAIGAAIMEEMGTMGKNL